MKYRLRDDKVAVAAWALLAIAWLLGIADIAHRIAEAL